MSSFAELQAQAYSDLRIPKTSAPDTTPVPIQPIAAKPPSPAGASTQPDSQPEPVPSAPEPAPAPEQPEQPPEPSAHTSPLPELKLDTAQDATRPQDDDAKRKAHEAAEAKRKAEWEAKQAEKKAARQAQLDKIAAMNRDELLAASVERVATDTERLTRRNMKIAVAEHIQAKCREDAAFAMQVMDPVKSMTRCFWYINRRAKEFMEKEIKDADPNPASGMYGGDVPDGLCYQWAEDYFHDPDAEEDHKNDEKFVPKPYIPTSANRKAAKGKADKKPASAEKPRTGKPAADACAGQISLM